MENLHKQYDKLQTQYGAKGLHSVYGCGCDTNAKIALVFMNPTKRNIATAPNWAGLRAQWLGTKQIWEFLTKCNLFDSTINAEIKAKSPKDWTPEFCDKVYGVVKQNGIWMTNLAKCTQEDARPLPDKVFKQYTELLQQELYKVNPQKILFFGNQVSSIMLKCPITVSTVRKKKFTLAINDRTYDSYAVYYPVGNGRFNQHLAIEDIKAILSSDNEDSDNSIA